MNSGNGNRVVNLYYVHLHINFWQVIDHWKMIDPHEPGHTAERNIKRGEYLCIQVKNNIEN